ncbi:hypothetical protein [Salinigranum sp. GCM10025319]|uniref:hypothetical protein n=1 Tax=Salinigranum sp. GCM10025319 TaxID=3252687 RepID=UPI003621A48C
MVKRRKFVIGLGALVAGSGAALGTGASVSSTMDRDANVDVVTDDVGLLALRDETSGDVVRQKNDGQLAIDFTANGNADGVNVDSRYQVGSFNYSTPGEVDPIQASGQSSVLNDPAFTITNQDTVERDVTLVYNLDGSVGGSQIYFQSQHESGSWQHHVRGPSGRRQSPNTHTLAPGETLAVSFQVDTGDGNPGFANTDGTPADDLSGTLDVSSQ